MSHQLALNLRLKDASSFGNFLAGPNREAMEQLRAAVVQAATQADARPAMIYLWGAEGAGKTHLLQAACRLAQEFGIAPAYIPLADVMTLGPSLLEGFEETPLACLDDVERVAGKPEWEAALSSLVENQPSPGIVPVSGEAAAIAPASPAEQALMGGAQPAAASADDPAAYARKQL